jgi:DDE family transposase
MDTDVCALLDRVPLAESVWLLWNEVLPDSFINQVFDDHRGRCYQRDFTLANLVHLVNDALFQHGGRGRQTLIRQGGTAQCPASVQAFYGKLRRVPVEVSEAFLADGAARLRPWLSARPYTELPASLREFRVLIVDGKTFKRAAKRLKPVRGRPGRGLGGKALVAMELSTGLLVAMAADPDAHANEARLVPRLLPQVRARLSGPRLHVADRQHGDLAQVRRYTEQGDHCVLRLHKHSKFTPNPHRPVRRGVDRLGRKWVDAVGTLTSTRQGALPIRRIRLQRQGQPPIEIITDLLDADRYPANDVLELYRQRWGIEQVFHKVCEVFHLSHLIGSSPSAIIFQGALCMMMYNLLQLVRMILADTQDRPACTISTFNLFYDLNRALITLHYLATPPQLLDALRGRANAVTDLRAYLHQRLAEAWDDRWIKSLPKKRHIIPSKHKRGTGGHFSIHRVLVESEKVKDV